MKKVLLFLAVASFAVMTTSCGMMGGMIYDGSTTPLEATGNTISKNAKVGTSSYTNILGAVTLGDGGINAAAKNGGITKISHIDRKNFSVLGIFAKYETTVYGE